jgi:ABC-type glycerol-3-phosphate transport system substrate-binding protein
VDYILYNREIFNELGITVPDDFQFTQDEFLDVVKKCSDAGYAGFANGGGNRPFPGQYISKAAILSLVGPKEFNNLWTGKTSWNTPQVRQALEWVAELGKSGLWHDSYATMTLDEAHLYFHTQKKACMFMNGSWYPSRAFKPEADGGQSPDFKFGMLKYPEMTGATSTNSIVGLFPTGYIVLSNSENKEIAKDIMKFWSENASYGATLAAVSNTASAIAFTPEDIPDDLKNNPWQWYWDEFNTVYKDVEPVVLGTPCGDFNDALTSALNQGIPLGLMTVDEAIAALDAKLCNK